VLPISREMTRSLKTQHQWRSAAWAFGLSVGTLSAAGPPLRASPPQGVDSAGGGGLPTKTPSELRLCSFNIQRFGHNNGKDYSKLAHILGKYCDGAVLLEVMHKAKGAPGLAEMLQVLGPRWRGTRTPDPRPLPANGNSEYYAVVWRDESLRQCDGWSSLTYVVDGPGSGTKKGDFLREPAFGCFQTRDGHFDFVLIGYHADYDSKLEKVASEVRHLDTALTQIKQICPEESDVFVLGDFNLASTILRTVTRHELLADDVGSTLGPLGERSRHQYDNVMFVGSRARTPELTRRAETLDLREEVGGPRVYKETVSDHLPVRLTLDLGAKDDDPACPKPIKTSKPSLFSGQEPADHLESVDH
jgi:hypothetical protein